MAEREPGDSIVFPTMTTSPMPRLGKALDLAREIEAFAQRAS